jgi:hypothetical protein
MKSIVVDEAVSTQLRQTNHTIDVCDGKGVLLGRFVPALDADAKARTQPSISEEDLDRRERAGGGRPLAHILADLDRRV